MSQMRDGSWRYGMEGHRTPPGFPVLLRGLAALGVWVFFSERLVARVAGSCSGLSDIRLVFGSRR